MTIGGLAFVAFLVALTLLVVYRPRAPAYVGYGWRISRNEETQAVYVKWCRPGCPAYLAGVLPGSTILEWDGVPVPSMTFDEYLAWLPPDPQLGQTTTFRLKEGDTDRVVSLTAVLIRSKRVRPHRGYEPSERDINEFCNQGMVSRTNPDGTVVVARQLSLKDSVVAEL